MRAPSHRSGHCLSVPYKLHNSSSPALLKQYDGSFAASAGGKACKRQARILSKMTMFCPPL